MAHTFADSAITLCIKEGINCTGAICRNESALVVSANQTMQSNRTRLVGVTNADLCATNLSRQHTLRTEHGVFWNSIRCNGRRECANGWDELGCDRCVPCTCCFGDAVCA